MTKRIATLVSGVVLLAGLGGSAHAQFNPNVIGDKIHHWEFNEANDTPLTGTMDSIDTTLNSMWSFDLGYNPTEDVHTAFVDDGAFLVQRPGGGHHINSFAPIDPVALGSDRLYLVADITWDYLNSTSGADMRFGFHNATTLENITTPDPGNAFPNPPVTIFSEIAVRRVSATRLDGEPIIPDQPVIGAFATLEDGTTFTAHARDNNVPGNTGYVPMGSTVQPDLVRVVLEIDQVDRWGAVHWSEDGGASYETLGGLGNTFDLAPTWDPNFVRLGALNNFVSGDGTGLRIEDLFVALPAEIVDPPPLAGDFNGDGVVDAADYTVWRDGLGTEFDQEHYDEWKANFGATAPGAAATVGAVPEPSSIALCLLAAAGLLLTPRRR